MKSVERNKSSYALLIASAHVIQICRELWFLSYTVKNIKLVAGRKMSASTSSRCRLCTCTVSPQIQLEQQSVCWLRAAWMDTYSMPPKKHVHPRVCMCACICCFSAYMSLNGAVFKPCKH